MNTTDLSAHPSIMGTEVPRMLNPKMGQLLVNKRNGVVTGVATTKQDLTTGARTTTTTKTILAVVEMAAMVLGIMLMVAITALGVMTAKLEMVAQAMAMAAPATM